MTDTSDRVERLRQTLPGVEPREFGGDNLAILLASYFEPGIESEELDDSGTWKQGAIDACDKVLDAIHAHYSTAYDELKARERENRATQQRQIDALTIRAETAEHRVVEVEASWRETMRKERDALLHATRLKDQYARERDEARAALKPFAEVADDIEENVSDKTDIWEAPCAMQITVGNLRAARAVIKQGE